MEPIIPGDFIVCYRSSNDSKEHLIHAGFHFSLKKMDAFCESIVLGSGIWNGKEVINIGESIATEVFQTGRNQIG